MHFTLFVDGYFCNPYDATCFIALEEKHQAFSTSRAMLRDNQGFPPAMYEHTPLARVPALAHGDFWLTESIAIVDYLDDVLPAPEHPRLLPEDPRERARARQIMAWVRIDLRTLRAERPFYLSMYPPTTPLDPLSPVAEREATELLDVIERLDAAGSLATWNISHADLALTLMRMTHTGPPLRRTAQRVLDDNLARPSVKSYVTHPRPPHPPP